VGIVELLEVDLFLHLDWFVPKIEEVGSFLPCLMGCQHPFALVLLVYELSLNQLEVVDFVLNAGRIGRHK
jgi:hypothetical protein